MIERSTRQRQAIRDVIEGATEPLLAQEVLERAQEAVPELGIATVYRNLKSLVDEGAVQSVQLPGENPRYELSAHPHHHHFQCRRCQRVFDVKRCPGDLRDLAPSGFVVEDHDITLYGRCVECAGRSAKPPSARARK